MSEQFGYCVYWHKDDLGNVVYVGSGDRKRPWDFRRDTRGEDWNEIFSQNFPTVEIVSKHKTYREAQFFELEVTNLLNRLFMIMENVRSDFDDKKKLPPNKKHLVLIK